MDNNTSSDIKGIKVKRLTIVLITLETLFFLVSGICAVITANKFNILDSLNQNYIQMQENIYSFRGASDYLTDRCRQFVMTDETQYAIDYCDEISVTCRRETAVNNIHKALEGITVSSESYLDEALEQSNELADTEIRAMALVYSTLDNVDRIPSEIEQYKLTEEECSMSKEARHNIAEDLVFNREYSDKKSGIILLAEGASNELLQEVRNYVEKCSTEYHTASILMKALLGISGVIFVILLYVFITLILIPIQNSISDIDKDQYIKYGKAYEINYLAYSFNQLQEKNVLTKLRLKDSAERDALTGLLNRNGYERITSYYSSNDEPIAFMIVDVDNFKEINDKYGHEQGDSVLRRIARVLKDSFRDTDYIVRFGGDEFIVIMTGVGSQNTGVVSKKLDRINEILSSGKEKPVVTVSIGVTLSKHGFTEELLGKADAALYETKKNGKCGYTFA